MPIVTRRNKSSKGYWLPILCFGSAWAYFLITIFLNETVLGVKIGPGVLLNVIIIGFGGFLWLVPWLVRKQILAMTRLRRTGLITSLFLLCLIGIDLGYSVYLNALTFFRTSNPYQEYYRLSESYHWAGELGPRFFYPTWGNFIIHKPNVTLGGDLYGGSYSSKLRESLPPNESVFQPRHVSFSIDKYGFRETTPLERADIFALGDSFTFGATLDQGKTWVKVLEKSIGIPTYNLGINMVGPKQELMLLEYMFQTQEDSFKIRHLLWMIYEGNDLEDSYETLRPIQLEEGRGFHALFAGTILESVLHFIYQLKNEEVIQKFRTGTVRFKDTKKPSSPLCQSPIHGYMFFPEMVLENANKPRTYVTGHPNRPSLEQVFKDMASLKRKRGFRVTVLLAPTAFRLYAPYFDICAPITDEPYFINYVADLSRTVGFDTINLLTLLQPYAKEELLYFRDDSHWNERGNELVAEIIRKRVFQQ